MIRFSSEKKFERREPKRSDRRESSRFAGRDSDRNSSRNSSRSSGRDFNEFEERSYGRERFSDRPSGRSERSSFEKSMHKVVCDKCGETCEVPFKPTSGKPIFCSDCFRKNERSNSDRGSDRGRSEAPRGELPRAELEEINRKLDKILKALKIN